MSLGSTESLLVTAQMMAGRELSAEQQRIPAITEGTMRLSIGLEDGDDLLAGPRPGTGGRPSLTLGRNARALSDHAVITS